MDTIIDTPQARYLGQRTGQVSCWAGIPYARAPVGALRFEPPQPAESAGAFTIDTRSPGAIAPQLPSRLATVMGHFNAHQSEDCLNLSIWRPEPAASQALPVLIWVHGGAWVSGGGALPWYDGAHLAATQQCIVVGINYRLGALGWLAQEEGDANLGLLDIELALQWVSRNIGCFGGDAGRMTAMGQSAGAENLASLLHRNPVFQRVILQSAPLGRPLRSLEQAYRVRDWVYEAWGVTSKEEAKRLPLDTLLAGQSSPQVVQRMQQHGMAGQAYGVVADGRIVPFESRADFMRSAAVMPSVIGATRDEMLAFPGGEDRQAHRRAGLALFNDGAQAWQQQAAAAGQDCWRYEFTWGPTESFGSCHCIDLPFTFGNWDAFEGAPMLAGGDPGGMRELGGRFQDMIGRMVRHGSPGWDAASDVQVF